MSSRPLGVGDPNASRQARPLLLDQAIDGLVGRELAEQVHARRVPPPSQGAGALFASLRVRLQVEQDLVVLGVEVLGHDGNWPFVPGPEAWVGVCWTRRQRAGVEVVLLTLGH